MFYYLHTYVQKLIDLVFNLNYDFFLVALLESDPWIFRFFVYFFHQPEQLPEIGGFFYLQHKNRSLLDSLSDVLHNVIIVFPRFQSTKDFLQA
jgi:hypothetical protein